MHGSAFYHYRDLNKSLNCFYWCDDAPKTVSLYCSYLVRKAR
nr:MAG TPA: hypothetical protein [Caudoviricetes sp.]